jgi:hypothetical protein
MFKSFCRLDAFAMVCALASSGCGGSSYSSSSSIPPSAGNAQVRFIDGAPSLETIIGSIPQNICPGPSAPCYLQVNGQTLTQLFYYGSITNFMPLSAGVHSMRALDTSGYAVGPLKTASLVAGHTYTLVVVGAYPKYEVLTFEEPKSSGGAQLSLYEASPSVPDIDFGRFKALGSSGFEKLGSAQLGNVVTVGLGKSVTDLGGYAGHGTTPIMCSGRKCGALTVAQINSFDTNSALPFNNAGRLSLFFFDLNGTKGPVFGSLDP